MNDWRQDLAEFFRTRGEAPHRSENELLIRRNHEVRDFMETIVIPAFEELRTEFEEYARDALIGAFGSESSLRILKDRRREWPHIRDEFEYVIKARVTPERAIPYAEVVTIDGLLRRRREAPLRESADEYSVIDITKDEVIRHALTAYKEQMARQQAR